MSEDKASSPTAKAYEFTYDAEFPNPRRIAYFCPGCQKLHSVPVYERDEAKPLPVAWHWNSSFEMPTLTPSVNVNPSRPERQCHHFVTGGKIHFQSDCYHSLRGQQNVEIPPVAGHEY